DAARSPQLVRLIDSLGTRLRRARVASLSLADRPARALDEHRALAAAVIARDPAKARVLAAEHAERGRRAATNWYLEHHRVTGTNGGGRS
ncbi:MAG TPA: FCD domain-containing protein, partial [Candidatus Limnocylindria bacterium]|nr:FCD domain-containing protein [Candidatus Limnocylindria bacterium]